MRGNTCTWGHVARFGTPLRLRLVTIGGGEGEVVCAWQGDLDTYYLVFIRKSVAWTRLGYFVTNDTTLHLRVEIKCMHDTEHD